MVSTIKIKGGPAPEASWLCRTPPSTVLSFRPESPAERSEADGAVEEPAFSRGRTQSGQEGAGTKPGGVGVEQFRHYLSGAEGVVEIESHWTARKRESMGLGLSLLKR